jgi:toxin ParE1/3/4
LAAKPVQFRDLATFDLELANGYYVAEADVATAIRFIDAVEATAKRIGRNPRLGSLRFAYELSVPDLRVVAVGRFPYLLFYLERETSVDVWRLLHTSRDIPASLREPDA